MVNVQNQHKLLTNDHAGQMAESGRILRLSGASPRTWQKQRPLIGLENCFLEGDRMHLVFIRIWCRRVSDRATYIAYSTDTQRNVLRMILQAAQYVH